MVPLFLAGFFCPHYSSLQRLCKLLCAPFFLLFVGRGALWSNCGRLINISECTESSKLNQKMKVFNISKRLHIRTKIAGKLRQRIWNFAQWKSGNFENLLFFPDIHLFFHRFSNYHCTILPSLEHSVVWVTKWMEILPVVCKCYWSKLCEICIIISSQHKSYLNGHFYVKIWRLRTQKL